MEVDGVPQFRNDLTVQEVLALLIQGKHTGDAGQTNFSDDQNVQQTVIHGTFRGGVESAAVPSAVAHSSEETVADDGVIVQGDLQLPVQLAQDIPQDGQTVGRLSAAQWHPPEFWDVKGDLGIQAGGGNGGAHTELRAEEVDIQFAPLELVGQVQEFLLGAKVSQKVVAAAIGDAPHGGIFIGIGPADDLVEGAVTAHGKEADGLAGPGVALGQLPGMSHMGGAGDDIVRVFQGGCCLGQESCKLVTDVPASGHGVHNKDRFHGGSSLVFLFVPSYPILHPCARGKSQRPRPMAGPPAREL